MARANLGANTGIKTKAKYIITPLLILDYQKKYSKKKYLGLSHPSGVFTKIKLRKKKCENLANFNRQV